MEDMNIRRYQNVANYIWRMFAVPVLFICIKKERDDDDFGLPFFFIYESAKSCVASAIKDAKSMIVSLPGTWASASEADFLWVLRGQLLAGNKIEGMKEFPGMKELLRNSDSMADDYSKNIDDRLCKDCFLAGNCPKNHPERLIDFKCNDKRCPKHYPSQSGERMLWTLPICSRHNVSEEEMIPEEVLDRMKERTAFIEMLCQENSSSEPSADEQEREVQKQLPSNGKQKRGLTRQQRSQKRPQRRRRRVQPRSQPVVDLTNGSSAESIPEEESGRDSRSEDEQRLKRLSNLTICEIDSTVTLSPQSNNSQKAKMNELLNERLAMKHYGVKKAEGTPLCGQIISTKLNSFILTDHSYYQNRPHNLECLGIQTPSESEEEIDVVGNSNPCLLNQTQPTIVSNQPRRQLTAKAAVAAQVPRATCTSATVPTPSTTTSETARTPRPRGRPPGNRQGQQGRKRPAPNQSSPNQQGQPPAKRQRTCAPRRQRTRAPRNASEVDENASEVDENASEVDRNASEVDRNASQVDRDADRRSQHNQMESTRRSELKMKFELLRREIPKTKHNNRAAKVNILIEATKYCLYLVAYEKKMEQDIIQMKAKIEAKKAHLLSLQHQLAQRTS